MAKKSDHSRRESRAWARDSIMGMRAAVPFDGPDRWPWTALGCRQYVHGRGPKESLFADCILSTANGAGRQRFVLCTRISSWCVRLLGLMNGYVLCLALEGCAARALEVWGGLILSTKHAPRLAGPSVKGRGQSLPPQTTPRLTSPCSRKRSLTRPSPSPSSG